MLFRQFVYFYFMGIDSRFKILDLCTFDPMLKTMGKSCTSSATSASPFLLGRYFFTWNARGNYSLSLEGNFPPLSNSTLQSETSGHEPCRASILLSYLHLLCFFRWFGFHLALFHCVPCIRCKLAAYPEAQGLLFVLIRSLFSFIRIADGMLLRACSFGTFFNVVHFSPLLQKTGFLVVLVNSNAEKRCLKNVSPGGRVMSPFGRVLSPFGRAMSPVQNQFFWNNQKTPFRKKTCCSFGKPIFRAKGGNLAGF